MSGVFTQEAAEVLHVRWKSATTGMIFGLVLVVLDRSAASSAD